MSVARHSPAPIRTETPALERAASKSLVFREVNERIVELTASFMDDGAKLFVCECGNADCAEALEVTLGEYEAVRRFGARFVVATGHQVDATERVVDQSARFVVVEKLGEAWLVAIAKDPRRS